MKGERDMLPDGSGCSLHPALSTAKNSSGFWVPGSPATPIERQENPHLQSPGKTQEISGMGAIMEFC